MIYYHGLYVTFCDDVIPNAGGYFCQVYTDRDLDYEIDCFCIHPYEFNTYQEAEERAKEYLDKCFPPSRLPRFDRSG